MTSYIQCLAGSWDVVENEQMAIDRETLRRICGDYGPTWSQTENEDLDVDLSNLNIQSMNDPRKGKNDIPYGPKTTNLESFQELVYAMWFVSQRGCSDTVSILDDKGSPIDLVYHPIDGQFKRPGWVITVKDKTQDQIKQVVKAHFNCYTSIRRRYNLAFYHNNCPCYKWC